MSPMSHFDSTEAHPLGILIRAVTSLFFVMFEPLNMRYENSGDGNGTSQLLMNIFTYIFIVGSSENH